VAQLLASEPPCPFLLPLTLSVNHLRITQSVRQQDWKRRLLGAHKAKRNTMISRFTTMADALASHTLLLPLTQLVNNPRITQSVRQQDWKRRC